MSAVYSIAVRENGDERNPPSGLKVGLITRSPYKRDQAVFDLLAVGIIAGEGFAQKCFLVQESQDDHRGIEGEGDQGVPGAQDQGDHGKQQDGGGIHGVADDAVKTRGHDGLALLDPNGPRQPAVLPEHLGVEKVGRQEQSGTHIVDSHGKLRPAEAEIKARQNEARQEHQSAELDNQILVLLLFFGIQTAAQEDRVLRHHHKACQKHGDEQNPHQKPATGIVHRSSGQEQHHRHQGDTGGKFQDRFKIEFSRHL